MSFSNCELNLWRCQGRCQDLRISLNTTRITSSHIVGRLSVFLDNQLPSAPSLNRSFRFLLRRTQSFLSTEVTLVHVHFYVISLLNLLPNISRNLDLDPEFHPIVSFRSSVLYHSNIILHSKHWSLCPKPKTDPKLS